jgi:signal transduction histidine kinase/CheY-like chemotaxis protein
MSRSVSKLSFWRKTFSKEHYWWPVPLASLACLVLTLGAAQFFYKRDQQGVLQRHVISATERVLDFKGRLETYDRIIDLHSAFYSASADVDEEAFATFTRNVLEAYPAINCVSWVTDADWAARETKQLPTFSLHNATLSYPRYLTTTQLDILRPAVGESRRGLFGFLPESAHDPASKEVVTVIRDVRPSARSQPSSGGGFLVVEFDLGRLYKISSYLLPQLPIMLQSKVKADDKLLFSSSKRGEPPSQAPLLFEDSVNIGGTPVLLAAYWLDDTLPFYDSYSALSCIACGSIFTVLLASYLTYILSNKKRIEDLVAHRTNSLRQATLEAQRASDTKSKFVANISHEIRTPMNAIIGFARTLLEPSLSEFDKNKAIRRIIRSGDHLLEIVNDILDIAKIESDKIEVEKIRFDLMQLVDEVRDLNDARIAEKGLTFAVHRHMPIPGTVTSDPLRLKQVMINLLGNATKFTERGHVSLAVSYDMVLELLQFKVSDTGVGMTSDQVAQLFKPFSQGDTSTTRKYGGSGLGLHIAHHLIQELGGTISVESLLGRGSIFTVSLPVTSAEHPLIYDEQRERSTLTAGSANSPSELQWAKLKGSILIAEDVEFNRDLLDFYLRKSSLDVTFAENGKVACELGLKQHFDVILMDMNMPVMDGYAAVAQLRSDGITVPIFALTASALKEDVSRCLLAGCTSHIPKPVEIEQLYEAIAPHLNTPHSRSPFSKDFSFADPIKLERALRYIQSLGARREAMVSAFKENDIRSVESLASNLIVARMFGLPHISLTARVLLASLEHSPNNLLAAKEKMEKLCGSIEEALLALPELYSRLQGAKNEEMVVEAIPETQIN